jgi:alpha-aminoadipic semialdehyde synthase
LLGSVDNLPAELPAEASQLFGDNLLPYVPMLAKADGTLPLEAQADDLGLVLHHATITNHGKLTPRYEYIDKLRKEHEADAAGASAPPPSTVKVADSTSTAGASQAAAGGSAAGAAHRGQGRQRVLLLGSGLVAGSYVHQLARLCGEHAGLTVAGADLKASEAIANSYPGARAVAVELSAEKGTAEAGASDENLRALVSDHDVVVSLLPAVLHPAVGGACIAEGKHMVSSSYISPGLAELDDAARDAGLTMLHECGLDPGIDHFMAVDLFQRARDAGRTITGFESWCGGLPAPYCAGPDDLGYKFSWSPRGVLVASQASARYREHGQVVDVASGSLIHAARPVRIGNMALQGTPNRDSVAYEDIYGIANPKLEIMLRGTLRYDGFWQAMGKLQTVGLLSADHWTSPPTDGCSLRELVQAAAAQSGAQVGDADLQAAEKVLASCAPRGLAGAPRVPAGGSPMDTLAVYLEQGLMYGPGEVDMVALTHRVTLDDGSAHVAELVCFGQPTGTSAMAHTVGAPAALATQYVLQGVVPPGVHRPMDVELCRKFLRDLESKMSIAFREY